MDDATVNSERAPSGDELDDMFSHPKEVVANEPARPTSPARGRWAMAGLLAAGAAVGAIAVSQLHGHSTSTATPAANTGTANGGTQGQVPGLGNGQLPGNGRIPGGTGGGPGGLAGEQHISGTVTAVGSSSVTVKSSSGTATYAVTSSSEIVRNGQAVSLTAIKAGDAAFVHVYPSNGTMTVERLFAGTNASAAQAGPGAPPGSTNT
jgi:hypothetical protein